MSLQVSLQSFLPTGQDTTQMSVDSVLYQNFGKAWDHIHMLPSGQALLDQLRVKNISDLLKGNNYKTILRHLQSNQAFFDEAFVHFFKGFISNVNNSPTMLRGFRYFLSDHDLRSEIIAKMPQHATYSFTAKHPLSHELIDFLSHVTFPIHMHLEGTYVSRRINQISQIWMLVFKDVANIPRSTARLDRLRVLCFTQCPCLQIQPDFLERLKGITSLTRISVVANPNAAAPTKVLDRVIQLEMTTDGNYYTQSYIEQNRSLFIEKSFRELCEDAVLTGLGKLHNMSIKKKLLLMGVGFGFYTAPMLTGAVGVLLCVSKCLSKRQ